MLVYGDPAFWATPEELSVALRGLAECGLDRDAVRDLLIAFGEVEQSVADTGADPARFCELTDEAAVLLLRSFRNQRMAAGDVKSLSEHARQRLAQLPQNQRLRIKIPEGYGFYAVYPEQYIRAAEAWLRTNPVTRPILVVGIRSIGTSLSAVVQARLRAENLAVRRLTVRPSGDPFTREATVNGELGGFGHAVVVDEGPGLSGSSIAAVVRALRTAGLSDVVILPSHSGDPGARATAEVRQIWAETRRYVCPAFGEPVTASAFYPSLLRKSEELLDSKIVETRDLSAGKWRREKPGGGTLPAVPELERAKVLMRAESRRAVIWKFAGLGTGPNLGSFTASAFARQERLAESRWCLPPLAISDGFVATEWIEARVASRILRDEAMAQRLARYIVASAGPPLPQGERRASVERLEAMLSVNLGESFPAPAGLRLDGPTAGDGRMAPHEWLCTEHGVLKTDVWGHACDHTCIGAQPLGWDIAGVLMEWELGESARAAFFRELGQHGIEISPATHDFYCRAYIAWQVGVSALFGQPERARFWRTRRSEPVTS